MAETPPIIIKKKAGHGGHHGGAWKVAYADFVTAMMALFIVLWLMNTNKPVQEAVSAYFRDPTGTSKKFGTDQKGEGAGRSKGPSESLTVSKDNMSQIKDQLQKAIQKTVNFEKFKDHVEMTVTAEGLRIELLEGKNGTFFQSGVARPTDSGQEILIKLAGELGKLPNTVALEGHTDATPYAGKTEYGNWELSSDRANAARRLMQAQGLRADQVTQVRGYADQRLRKPQDPLDPSNRRISVIVQYQSEPPAEERSATAPAPTPPKPSEAAAHPVSKPTSAGPAH
jgi:chemotaxis protein MotB